MVYPLLPPLLPGENRGLSPITSYYLPYYQASITTLLLLYDVESYRNGRGAHSLFSRRLGILCLLRCWGRGLTGKPWSVPYYRLLPSLLPVPYYRYIPELGLIEERVRLNLVPFESKRFSGPLFRIYSNLTLDA